ncbi:hypothetical protein [Flavicella marina]|uniref:hypothetical protein n=1 Tax=Flavicella marina TaxID=1475951 RepID=UPI0012653881|nr:hypothetical protein [Flavicella marina]
MKKSLLFLFLTLCFTFTSTVSTAQEANNTEASKDYPTLPVGTILFLKVSKDVYAKNFKVGDHFFVDLDRDVTSKGKVLIPKGTLVQMEVLVSEHTKRRGSKFAITVGGFIIDNFVQTCKTEGKQVETQGNGRNTLRKAAIGAGVGAAFDGGEGAGKGAAVGAAVGMLQPGTVIYFPKGTEGTFQLTEPLVVNWLDIEK